MTASAAQADTSPDDGSDTPQQEVGETAIGDAQARVAALLSALRIDEVIVVDDYNFIAGQATPNEISEAMASSEPLFAAIRERLRAGAAHLGFDQIDDENRSQVGDYLIENWAGLPPELQTDLTASLRTQQQDDAEDVDDEQIRDDLSASEALQQVVLEPVVFRPLSMTEWVATWRDIVSPDRRYLVLIDRTLTREHGGGADTGVDLLRELLDGSHPGVFAGLFTRRAGDEAGEQAMIAELQARMPDHAQRLVVLGKFRARSIATLPAGLRTILLADELGKYRDLAIAALDAGNEAAKTRLGELNNYQLVEAMAAAQREGIFELDHPIRLAQRTQSEVVARHLRGSGFPPDSLDALRAGAISAFRNAERDDARVRQMLHEDKFEMAGTVAELGLPIEVGDIFVVESLLPVTKARPAPAPKHFVLLGQACDLTLRGRGAREPHVPNVTLHGLSPRGGAADTQHAVGYFDPDKADEWSIKFKETIVVPIDAIDATVFGADGRSLIDLAYVENRPMAQGWPARLVELQKRAKGVIETVSRARIDLKAAKGRDEWLGHLVASLSGGSATARGGVTVRVDEKKGQLEYGIRRIGRVRHDTAARLADAASAFEGRPAFEAEIAMNGGGGLESSD